MAGLGQRILDKGAKRLFGFRDAELGLTQQLKTQRRQHGLQFGKLALVIGCKYDFHDE